MPQTVFILNGPNLNLLGKREPEIYGRQTLADIESDCRARATPLGLVIDFRQSHHGGVLVVWIQEARERAASIIINPGALTHTSIAIHDALKAFAGPIVEVPLSNIHQRQHFRHRSCVSLRAPAVIAGCGAHGYVLAVEAIARWLEPQA